MPIPGMSPTPCMVILQFLLVNTYHLSPFFFFVIYRRPFLQIITLTILRPLVLGINQCKRHKYVPLYLFISLFDWTGVLPCSIQSWTIFWYAAYCRATVPFLTNWCNTKSTKISETVPISHLKNMWTDYRFLIHFLYRL